MSMRRDNMFAGLGLVFTAGTLMLIGIAALVWVAINWVLR